MLLKTLPISKTISIQRITKTRWALLLNGFLLYWSLLLYEDELEKIVVDTTINVLGNNENLDCIIDAVMEARKKKAHDESVLNLLAKDLAETEKAIENLLNAIQQGILTSATKGRMEELERHADELKTAIALEQHKKAKR